MSLDIWLLGPDEEVDCVCEHCDNRHTRITQHCFFEANITHNLQNMAEAAGLLVCLWQPLENGLTKASQLIEPLEKGLELLRFDPAKFKKLAPLNGYGTYEGLVRTCESYLTACNLYPDANIHISR
jgi:hypothetical protein